MKYNYSKIRVTRRVGMVTVVKGLKHKSVYKKYVQDEPYKQKRKQRGRGGGLANIIIKDAGDICQWCGTTKNKKVNVCTGQSSNSSSDQQPSSSSSAGHTPLIIDMRYIKPKPITNRVCSRYYVKIA